jgi:hypothetical protein
LAKRIRRRGLGLEESVDLGWSAQAVDAVLCGEPAAEARYGGEGADLPHALLVEGCGVLDQRVSKTDAAQARLAGADRVEGGAVGRGVLPRRREDGLDAVGQSAGQRDLDEDQRIVGHDWMEMGPAATVEEAPQVAPFLDLMDHLGGDDVLEQGSRAVPGDVFEAEHPAPREQGHAAAQDRLERVVGRRLGEQGVQAAFGGGQDIEGRFGSWQRGEGLEQRRGRGIEQGSSLRKAMVVSGDVWEGGEAVGSGRDRLARAAAEEGVERRPSRVLQAGGAGCWAIAGRPSEGRAQIPCRQACAEAEAVDVGLLGRGRDAASLPGGEGGGQSCCTCRLSPSGRTGPMPACPRFWSRKADARPTIPIRVAGAPTAPSSAMDRTMVSPRPLRTARSVRRYPKRASGLVDSTTISPAKGPGETGRISTTMWQAPSGR